MKFKGASVLIIAGMLSLSGCGGGNSDSTTGNTLVSASLVLGQSDFVSDLPNQGNAADANTLNQPLGDAAFDATDGAMFVPDSGNNRVLRFDPIPTSNGDSANATFGVIGQAGFTANSPNAGTTVNSNGLVKPGKIWIYSNSTYKYFVVTDTANNRVLIYNSIPTTAGPTPIAIIGQSSATSASTPGPSACTASSLDNPTAAIIVSGPTGLELLVVDQGDDRVLIWNLGTAAPTTGAAADTVLGQASLTSCNSPSPYGTYTESASTLDNPTDVWSDGYNLLVTDTYDDRVLYWSQIPSTDGAPAQYPLGQSSFAYSSQAVTSSTLNDPAGITSDGARVFVADTGDNRVMIFEGFPSGYSETASFVLGQDNFSYSSPNDDNGDSINPQTNPGAQANAQNAPTQRTLNGPTGLAYNSADGSLWVTDHGNNRILQFNKTALSTSEVVN